jgi:glycosyltransferase involved in cell wall biosynthesis
MKLLHRECQTIPAISVLMPVYNAERYVALAIDSILKQTWTDFEFIIINDGSTDNSLQILQQFADQDNRIRLISRGNRGLVASLNQGIELARAPFIARMDADDIAHPERFEQQAAFLFSHADCVVVGSWVETINETGCPIATIKTPADHATIDGQHLSGHTSICHPTVLMRRDPLIMVNGYVLEMDGAEDLDLWLRLAEIGKLANISRTLLKYRLHNQSISGSKRSLQKQLMKMSCERAWARREIPGKFDPSAGDWRPGDDVDSQHCYALSYGWQAWNHGHKKTWWVYARQAIAMKPFSLSSWKLLFFGFIHSPR